MASQTTGERFDSALRTLVSHRLAVYVGGLVVILAPRIARTAFGVETPAAVRTLLVAVALGAMILTYVGERRVGDRDTGTSSARPPGDRKPADSGSGSSASSGSTSSSASAYSRRTRVTVAIGIAGIAIGIYLAARGETIIGVLFVVGGLFFGQTAYRADREAS